MIPGISNPADYVHVEDDGTARELEADEIEYLGTAFHGADGARPYIKGGYEQLTPDNRIGGYLLRDKLPAGVRIKSRAEAVPVLTSDDAIRIAKDGLPAMFVAKSGTQLVRVVGRSGRPEFGLPGLEVAHGNFSATLSAGVWRVVRLPDASRTATEQASFVDVSAASGRVMKFGPLATPREPTPIVRPIPGASGGGARRPWWKFWT